MRDLFVHFFALTNNLNQTFSSITTKYFLITFYDQFISHWLHILFEKLISSAVCWKKHLITSLFLNDPQICCAAIELNAIMDNQYSKLTQKGTKIKKQKKYQTHFYET